MGKKLMMKPKQMMKTTEQKGAFDRLKNINEGS